MAVDVKATSRPSPEMEGWVLTPKAVLLSYAEFEALTKASTPALDDLSDDFDRLLERMQTPQARTAMASAFDASPEQLGRAAVKAARAKR